MQTIRWKAKRKETHGEILDGVVLPSVPGPRPLVRKEPPAHCNNKNNANSNGRVVECSARHRIARWSDENRLKREKGESNKAGRWVQLACNSPEGSGPCWGNL